MFMKIKAVANRLNGDEWFSALLSALSSSWSLPSATNTFAERGYAIQAGISKKMHELHEIKGK